MAQALTVEVVVVRLATPSQRRGIVSTQACPISSADEIGKDRMAFVTNWDELPLSGTVRLFEGYQYGDTHLSFFLIDVPPGDGPDLHMHPYEEVFVVQEGQVTFTVGDATIAASGGQIVIAPAGAHHKFVNSGSGPLRQINIHPSPRVITTWVQD